MKKLLRWLLRIIISLVVLLVVVAIVVPLVFDPNDYKQEIEQQIQQNINRTAHLDGVIEWSVFPWLALTFNDVSIDNASGFRAEKFATIEKMSARVKLMPLLSRNIEVGDIVIDQAVIALQVLPSGKNNWQSIGSSTSAKADDSDVTATDSALNIKGIQLSNSRIDYHDEQSNTQATISDLSLNMSEIGQDKTVKTTLSMRLQMPDTGLNVLLSSHLGIHHLLTDTALLIDIKDFELEGQLSSDSQVPMTVSLNQAGTMDLGKDTLVLPQVTVKVAQAEFVSDVMATQLSTKAKFSGKYTLAEFNLNNFFKQLSGTAVVSSDVLDAFSSSGSWQLFTNALKIDDLRIAFDKSELLGQANILDLDTLTGKFQLQVNYLDVDKFLAQETEVSGTTATNNSSQAMEFGHLTGSISIDSMRASGATMENINMQVQTNGAKMVLDPVVAKFYQGNLKTSVNVDTSAEKNKISIDHSMTKIQAGPLLTDIMGSELMTGVGDLTVDLSIDEPFADVPLKTAHGKISYNLGNGAIYGVDVFGMLQQGLTVLYPEMQQAQNDGVKKTTFAMMQIDADINAGILKTNVFKIESPYLLVTGDISIDLVNRQINGSIAPTLLDIPEQFVSDKYKNLLNIPIPVILSGSLLEPTISIDAKKILLNSQKQRIDKEKDKLKDKLFDSLLGNKKKKK